MSIDYIIIGDDGSPVDDAEVRIWWSNGGGEAEGHTDDDGKVTLSSKDGTSLYVYVEKEGYYKTEGKAFISSFTRKENLIREGSRYYEDVRHGNLVLRRPPARFEIVLKKIIDPVPMYHKVFKGDIPKLNEPVGFDLEKGDWVMPYGEGVKSDCIFTASKDVRGDKDFRGDLLLTFSNDQDGIQDHYARLPNSIKMRSKLTSPQLAPLKGYGNSHEMFSEWELNGYYQSHDKEDRSYLFRVRSEVNEEGEVVKANYGKTLGEIRLEPRNHETVWIKFEYYYNPDPESRSLEFNGVNLFEE